ncbi:MAG: Fe-S cluster assembly protein SufD [Candidatus Omnitrophica bacterium]|nr:Fe-S cluster assembly protein SufD [Candidatus Omnitrophota bacterium]
MSNNISFINNFKEEAEKTIKEDSNSWLKDLRNASLARVNELKVPTTKDEEWKYTNLSTAVGRSYALSQKAEFKEKEGFDRYTVDDKIRVTFVNGVFSQELSKLDRLPKGLTILPLKEAIQTEEPLIQKILNKYETNKTTLFAALNTVLMNAGVFIKVDANVIIEDDVHVLHVMSSSNGESLSLPRSIIYLGKSAEATVLESHVAFTDDITYFVNALNDIYLSENATLHYCKAQKESLKAFHVGNSRVWQEANSNLDSISVVAGAALARNDIDIILEGEGINSTLNGLYSVYGDQHVDNHTSVDHRFPNCVSNQLYKGVLNGAARAVFNGKIFVRDIAQQTNSYQLNKNLLLGKDCRVDTKPQLEIFADDVKCTHGATVGQLNEDELFYLETRCIPRKAAIKMLARGFVDDLLNDIKSRDINDKLHILLEPSFEQL